VSKMSMDWHRECLKNYRHSTKQLENDVERRVADLANRKRNLAFYEEQFAAAEKRGMEGFDRERLLIKRSA
jgi:hypothetical protein